MACGSRRLGTSEPRPTLAPRRMPAVSDRQVLDHLEFGPECQLLAGREYDGKDPAARSDQTAGQVTKRRPVFGVDRTEKGVVEQEVIQLIVLKGESVFGNEPAPERTKPTPDQGFQFGGIIDRRHVPSRACRP